MSYRKVKTDAGTRTHRHTVSRHFQPELQPLDSDFLSSSKDPPDGQITSVYQNSCQASSEKIFLIYQKFDKSGYISPIPSH